MEIWSCDQKPAEAAGTSLQTLDSRIIRQRFNILKEIKKQA